MKQDSKKIWEKKYDQLNDDTTLKDKVLAGRLLKLILDEIDEEIKDKARVLEIGCGTGFLLEHVKTSHKTGSLVLEGVDLAESAVLLAKEKRSEDIAFFNMDIFEFLQKNQDKYSLIISMRCVQNILSNQDDIFPLLYNSLQKNGKLILCEGTTEGLRTLNREREKLGLKGIDNVPYNKYLSIEHIINRFGDLFSWEIKECCSTYMLITRVIYPFLEQAVRYNQKIHEYADSLGEFGNFGYYKLFIGRKNP